MTGIFRLTLFICPLVIAGNAGCEPQSDWARVGAALVVAGPTSERRALIDNARVQAQQVAGCQSSAIRYGDTALMRGFKVDAVWPAAIRDLASAAAISDDKASAIGDLATAIEFPSLTTQQRHALENRMVLTAMQFDDFSLAKELLKSFGFPSNLAGPLKSDRLFWSVYIQTVEDPTGQAVNDAAERLEMAIAADPTSFQVLFLRAVNWLGSGSWSRQSCAEAVEQYSDILLDLSDAGSCPLMVGHMYQAVALELGSNWNKRFGNALEMWLDFTQGLLAVASKNEELALQQSIKIRANKSNCNDMLSEELVWLIRS